MERYEDMFREITRKLYGEEEGEEGGGEYERISGTGGEEEWVSSQEEIPWTRSKIASYSWAQKLFRCNECECVGFLSRVAEHWLGTHANLRVFQCPECPYSSAWARCVRMHLARQHELGGDPSQTFCKENPVLEEVTEFLERLKERVEREGLRAPPVSEKRYTCRYCPYTTDRRDLYSRHENIHRQMKPFHCYICLKEFNRADHVKKHFVRIHRGVPYETSRIKVEGRKEADKTRAEPNRVEKKREPEKRYSCSYCTWSGVDNWCLKRHLNTHLKPYVCALCEYKAARSERLATHVVKVHNKRLCPKCSFLAEDESNLHDHLRDRHRSL